MNILIFESVFLFSSKITFRIVKKAYFKGKYILEIDSASQVEDYRSHKRLEMTIYGLLTCVYARTSAVYMFQYYGCCLLRVT